MILLVELSALLIKGVVTTPTSITNRGKKLNFNALYYSFITFGGNQLQLLSLLCTFACLQENLLLYQTLQMSLAQQKCGRS